MSEISFFEVFAGTAVRSRPSSGRVSASSPCPSVLLRRGGGVFPSFPVSLMSVLLLCLFLTGVPQSVPPWVARLRGPLLLRVFLCESLCPSSVVSSAPFPVGHSAPGPVACPCDSGPGGGLCCCLPVLCLLPACRVPSSALADAFRAPGKRREGGGRRGKMPESAGQAGGKLEKTEKVEKKSKKTGKKFGNPAKSATFAVPFRKGALGAPPRIGGSSLNRKKEARAGPAVPAPSGRGQKSRPVQGKKTKVVLYNEEFDPGSG